MGRFETLRTGKGVFPLDRWARCSRTWKCFCVGCGHGSHRISRCLALCWTGGTKSWLRGSQGGALYLAASTFCLDHSPPDCICNCRWWRHQGWASVLS